MRLVVEGKQGARRLFRAAEVVLERGKRVVRGLAKVLENPLSGR